ncbi:hypothetical protein RAS1_30820 [Phycisphaerae bacterium RAS1]|nr:hypothetical protein RAS1_30820 [Phycisphaerae bacterium RAS1]
MISVLLVAVAAVQPLDVASMTEVIRARLARLDRLVVDIECRGIKSPLGADPRDFGLWREFIPGLVYPFRVTVVRPNALMEKLLDDEENGAVPVAYSIWNETVVSRHLRPDRNGRTVYSVVDMAHLATGISTWPVLQALDVQIHDALISQLNTLRLFSEYPVELRCAISDDGAGRYAVTVFTANGAVRHDYELDLAPDGAALRTLHTTRWDAGNIQPISQEMIALAFAEVNGERLPSEVIHTVVNPNVQTELNLSEYQIWHLQAVGIRSDPELTEADIRILPEYRNSNVAEYHSDGTAHKRFYDDQGQVVYDVDFYSGRGVPDAHASATRTTPAWRALIPLVAAVAGVGIGFLQRFVVGRAARKTRCN